MNLYLLNALIMPFETKKNEIATFIAQKITKEKYEEIMTLAKKEKRNIKSFIGHNSTVNFLKEILPSKLKSYIKYNRGHLMLKEGDMALVFRITERGEMLKEFTIEELRKFYKAGKYEFVLISRVYAPEAVLNPANYFKKGGNK
ncbi:MAG: STIV orfB116 family protein [Bacteroidales bacterium]